MKILIVVSRLPHPLEKADGMTVYRMIKYLAPRHEIYLACFHERDEQLDYLPEVQKYCAAVECVRLKRWRALANVARGLFVPGRPLQVSYYRDLEMQAAVDRLIAKYQPDLAYAQLIRAAPYIQNKTGMKRVLGMQISQTLNYSRMIRHARSLFHRVLYAVEYRKVRRYEPAITRRFDSCLCISRHDKEALAGHEQIKNMAYCPHGIDVRYFTAPGDVPRQNAIVFSAFLDAPTNVDAILYFYEEIYPLVKQQVPDVRLFVIGKSPRRAIRRIPKHDSSVEVTGFLKDMRPYYEIAKVGIDPVRIAAGMQNKLLTGMCMDVPMVATSIANEGIGAEHGKHLLVADRPADFAEGIVTLMRDDAKARQMAAEARRFVEQYWTWEYHFEKFESHLHEVLHGPHVGETDTRRLGRAA